MAITKIMTIKSCGDGFPGRHLKQAIDYIINPEKTQELRYVGGVNCQPQEAFVQMKATKRKFGKMDKRQGYHFVISFEEEDVEPSVAYDITTRFVEEFLGEEYEAVYAVHDDTLHRHGHIIFNSVNYRNGKKFRYEKGDWEKIIQPITNRLCEEYGLATIDVTMDGVAKSRTMSNWKEYQEYHLTWKDYINDDWYSIFIKGSGDCMASRYAVVYLCEYIGVKAQACRSVNAHGMTVVQADGKFYLIVTGYEGKKPRDYSMYEIDEATVRSYGEKYNLYIAYFGLE